MTRENVDQAERKFLDNGITADEWFATVREHIAEADANG